MSKYKWIRAEMESLDPEVDYERIWQLMTCYYFNDFHMNFLYTVQFPYYIITPEGAEAVSRGGSGKLINQQDKREHDTAVQFWKWFEYGPSHPITQESVKKVNGIHAAIAKKLPGRFARTDDFTFTMCMLGADLHRLRLRVGLPGFTDYEKTSSHHYWQAMSRLFRAENDTPIIDFPDDFAGMLAYLDEYEARDWPHTREGEIATKALIDQFANRWFPRGLRFVGRTLILSMFNDTPHRVHHLPYPNPVARKAMELGFAASVFLQEKILPDPHVSTPERHRSKEAVPS